MKISRARVHQERQILDKKIKPWMRIRNEKPPRSGWINAIRTAFGLSTYQLAKRMGISQATVSEMEAREKKGGVTLETLERAANAMDCQLIYALVPKQEYSSLEEVIEKRSVELAAEILNQVEHSMRLEKQGVGFSKKELLELANKLKQDLDPRIWNKKR